MHTQNKKTLNVHTCYLLLLYVHSCVHWFCCCAFKMHSFMVYECDQSAFVHICALCLCAHLQILDQRPSESSSTRSSMRCRGHGTDARGTSRGSWKLVLSTLPGAYVDLMAFERDFYQLKPTSVLISSGCRNFNVPLFQSWMLLNR